MIRLALLMVAATSSMALADKVAESKPRMAARNYLRLLFDSKAPPFASKAQPIVYSIPALVDACKGMTSGRAVDDAGSKKLKACAVALKAQLREATDAVELDEMKPATLKALLPKGQYGRLAALKSATVVTASYNTDDATLDMYFALNAERRILGIWMVPGSAD